MLAITVRTKGEQWSAYGELVGACAHIRVAIPIDLVILQ
jgi:hypothetical protein